MKRIDDLTRKLREKSWLKRGLIFTLLWILLTQGNPDSWIIGVFVVPLATWCASWLLTPTEKQATGQGHHVNLISLACFLPFFAAQSIKGGWDSALFALHPKRRVNPGFINYKSSLPEGRPRVVFLNIVSLLPGTVSAAKKKGSITVHVLDRCADNEEALQACESRIADLFDLEWNEPMQQFTHEDGVTR